MDNNIYSELFKVPSEKFKKHLESDINERILFSGKFGKGKTTFLQYFFDNKEKPETDQKYFTIHISPVNYAVATNEDIFKLIKFDIILEFLRKGIEFEESDFDFMDTLPLFIRQNPEKIIGKLLSFIPVVGKEVDEVFKKGKKLYEEVKKHNSGINDKGEANQLEKYIETIETAEGSIYENDFITKIIEKAISKLESQDKKTILIIDDLDRLDPDHIFRILNVFASQFDNYKNTQKSNKFNLSKIVIVCDLDNIRNIYKNRYGADVDFVGYVNKFYSTEPFYFNNYEQLNEIVRRELINIKLTGDRLDINLINYIAQIKSSIGIYELISNFLFFDFLSLRSLLNYSKQRKFELYKTYQIGEGHVENDRSTIVIEAQIITGLLGGYENSIQILSKLENLDSKVNRHEYYYRSIFYYLSVPKNGNVSNENDGKYFQWDGQELFYTIQNNQIDNLQRSINGMKVNFLPSEKDYFRALKLVLQKMYINGIIE